MHFLAKQNALLESLSVVERAIPIRTPIQIIKGILVEAKNNSLTFMANNLEMAIRSECNVVEIKEEGAVVLPDKLVDIIRQVPTEDLEIKTDGEELRTEILSNRANFFFIWYECG
jgi:DNA polymerase-3 subunit beta